MPDDILDSAIFDTLRQATANDPEILRSLCRDFLVEARGSLAKLREAVSQGDAGAVYYHAHYVKGSSQVLGAVLLTKACAVLEGAGRSGELSHGADLLKGAQAALASTQSELAAKLGDTVVPAEEPAA